MKNLLLNLFIDPIILQIFNLNPTQDESSTDNPLQYFIDSNNNDEV